MAEPERRRATYQDVLDAPDHKVAEIVNGELHLSPRPAAPPAVVSSALGAELTLPFGRGRGGPGGWILLVADEPYFTLAPDWICEVLSRSTEKLDRAEKLAVYATAGVGHAWLVSPRLRTLEVLRLHDGKWLALGTYRDDDRVRAEPFDAFELELAVLWADLGPPLRAAERIARYGEAAADDVL